jgi:predicted dehydrogenase
MSAKTRVGIIGCGNISQAYFTGLKMFNFLEVVACADLNAEAAEAKAKENAVKALSVDELLASPEVDIVVNLTVPKAHAEISVRALEAGKHVHSEKPLAISVADGERIVAVAKRLKLRAGCAPDTFLGAGLQTCRKAIDDGWIGRPVAGTAFMLGHGPEAWHPNPFFFYDKGGGPMLDMGPYYVTALINLLGPVKSVQAIATKSFEERLATCKEHFGEKIPVKVPTHNTGNIVFDSGAVVTTVISFDIWKHNHQSPIELYGSQGTMLVPDPNTFGGPVKIFRPGNETWSECPLTHAHAKNSRGMAVADMALAIREGRPHRCSAELALHALEVMFAFEESSKSGQAVAIKNRCEQPQALAAGTPEGMIA